MKTNLIANHVKALNSFKRVKATWRKIWRILSWRTNFFTWRTQTVGELLLAVTERKIQFSEHRREFRELMTLRQDFGGETRP